MPKPKTFSPNYDKFEFDGKSYLEDCKTGNIYDLTTKKHIGKWNWSCDDIEWKKREKKKKKR